MRKTFELRISVKDWRSFFGVEGRGEELSESTCIISNITVIVLHYFISGMHTQNVGHLPSSFGHISTTFRAQKAISHEWRI
jgi:hypothetical protein